tara:strand:- start:1996 stop:4530 length:2535 start_codon:yes stop_codon:yes gene_type:complete
VGVVILANAATAQTGSLVEPIDAGKGPEGVVARWQMELDLSSKDEKFWRERVQDVNARYRDEKNNQQSNTTTIGRYGGGDRFNILYSNIQTICPSLYSQTPNPDVRRRYRDQDETGKTIADVMERALSFTLDDEDFDRYMRMAVKDCQLTGRGVTRVKYEAAFGNEEEIDGPEGEQEYEVLEREEVEFEHVNWSDYRHGPGRTWEEVMWIAFKHTFDKDELEHNFPDTAKDIPLDYSPDGIDENNDDPINDTFKRAIVWEIWDKKKREVVFMCPGLKERPCKTVKDPLSLKDFWPIPRPLYASDYTDSLVPVEPFRYYEDQADELDDITRRISGVIAACKVRGIYDSTISEMTNIMDSQETMLVPATDVLPLMQAGGLERAIWIWPIEKIAGVLIHLYSQREAVKTIIYEITGIADIMRGSSSASETLGAQQLKAQFGTMRLDDMRREVQRFARDLVRISAEIIAEQFSPETMAIMTEVKLPTPEEKMQAQMMAQQMQQQQQPIPRDVQKVLDDPTWDECLQILRDDQQRAYRIDIETDSTVAGDQAQEKRNITELLTGIASFIQNAGPAVAAGYLPLDAAKALLMTSVRKFKMGREVEDALDMIGEDQDEEQQPDPALIQMQQQMEQMQPVLQQLQQENEQLKNDKSAEMQRTQMDVEKTAAELEIKRGDQQIKVKDLELKSAQPVVTPQEKWEYDMQVNQMQMAFDAEQKALDRAAEAEQKALDREADIAKAIIAKADDETGIEGALADLHANKTLTYNDDGSISGFETTDIESTISRIRDVLSQQSSADRGGMEQALVGIAEMQAQTGQLIIDSNDRLANAITAPKRAIYENGRPVGIETI